MTTLRRTIVSSLDQIPSFSSEDEERNWWATHELSEELYDSLAVSPAESDRILGRLKPHGLVRITVEGLPPVYGAALSLLSAKHPHAKRTKLLRDKAVRAMSGQKPWPFPVRLRVSQLYSTSKADAANIIGAISNALEGIVYVDDSLIREAHFRSRSADHDRYTVTVSALG